MMNTGRAVITFIAVQVIVLILATFQATAEKRVALVIGNESYANTSNLYNPMKDSRDIAAALRRLEFKVTELQNISLEKMRKEVIKFGRLARRSDMAVIYFAGHGIEVGGENWLIPVDAHLLSDIDVEDEAIGLSYVMGKLRGTRKLSLIILDACRNNPFASKMKRTSGISRAVSRGFSRVEPEENLMVAYAAREGTLADDGNTGENSPYATALLNNLETPDVDIRILFGKIRDEVRTKTGKRQIPHTYGSLPGHRILLNTKKSTKNIKPIENVDSTPQEEQREQFERERAKWEAIKETNNPMIIRRFLAEFPGGVLTSLAQYKLDQLKLAAQQQKALLEQGEKIKQLERLEQQRFASLQNEEKQIKIENEPEIVAPERLVTTQIIRSIQTEFNRLGCNAGTPDGKWGRKSVSALSSYAKHANIRFASTEPTIELYDSLRSRNGRVCPLVCGVRFNRINGQCVVKTCGPGEKLSNKGNCYKPKTKTASKSPNIQVKRAKPTNTKKRTPAKSGCFEFNGKMVCE